MAGKPVKKPRKLSVYLYIPNIVGYIRVLMNCVAFAICFSNKQLFSVLYFVSFVCDGVDGWLARKFNQVSTFGAVLDMVTDRISTACLLVILSQVYRPSLIFLLLLALDIASHWLQMYSTFLSGKVSHKDVKDSTNWLFRAYYGHRMFMAYCCVACEVLYILLFLRAEEQTENLMDVLRTSASKSPILLLVLALSLFGWTIKQTINVIQVSLILNKLLRGVMACSTVLGSCFVVTNLSSRIDSFWTHPSATILPFQNRLVTLFLMKTAADVCVLYDINKKQGS